MEKKMYNRMVSAKVQKIMHEGVRKNTHMPVSASNPRRHVPARQAVAIARSMIRKGRVV